MKISKKCQQKLAILDKYSVLLEYYLSGNDYAIKEMYQDFHELDSYIQELALDKKEHNARFYQKLKMIQKLEENNDE